MRILHFCADLAENNGMANTARQFVAEELAEGHDSRLTNCLEEICEAIDVVHIHGAWLPAVHRAAKRAKEVGAKLVIRPAGSYDPVRRRFHGWKKLLMTPWERAMLRRADVIQATCSRELEWIRTYLGERRGDSTIEITDLKRFFEFGVENRCRCRKDGEPLHVLYLGRQHPLKGVKYLEEAVAELNGETELRIESNLFGEAKEAAWDWCDVLCLPTLSENFGRVIAEALAHGKRVITTDGAPAWESFSDPKLIYLRGYRDGTAAERVQLLKRALKDVKGQVCL